MPDAAKRALSDRIRELRRRYFGARGREEFARRLQLPLEEYERYERGTLPGGDVLVRMCEVTGEDLQWLLTGVASRGTIVISQTRTRHQQLLTRLATFLEARPARAAAVEAFVDLLERGEAVEALGPECLPAPSSGDLIPIFAAHELPVFLPPGPHGGGSREDAESAHPPDPASRERWPALLRVGSASHVLERRVGMLAEPAGGYDGTTFRQVPVLTLANAGVPDHDDAGATRGARRYVHSPEIVACFPGIFGVQMDDDAMRPMFVKGDAILVATGSGAQVGRPALCRLASGRGSGADALCRIWLGEEAAVIRLGRVADGEIEQIERADLCWSLEVLYRLAAA